MINKLILCALTPVADKKWGTNPTKSACTIFNGYLCTTSPDFETYGVYSQENGLRKYQRI